MRIYHGGLKALFVVVNLASLFMIEQIISHSFGLDTESIASRLIFLAASVPLIGFFLPDFKRSPIKLQYLYLLVSLLVLIVAVPMFRVYLVLPNK